MNIILHDLGQHLVFAPLTLTRPVGNLRTGMWTNDQRWKTYLPDATISFHTTDYLSKKFPRLKTKDNYWINAAVIPTSHLVEEIKHLKEGETLYQNDSFIAYRGEKFQPKKETSKKINEVILLEKRWDLFKKNDRILSEDFDYYTKDKISAQISTSNILIGDEKQLFIEEGATVEGAILNVKTGPIYIGKNAEIMEGSVVRGGLAMAPNSVLKLSAKIYGATSLGEYCKVGGEVSNTIFQAYSNKGHDGFIGNALIGEWCNIGADTNSSNLKNNYGLIKTYNYKTGRLEKTEEQFMGLTMGDFSKTGINTMLNTATIIDICSNLFHSGFPPKYIPAFSWGGHPRSPLYKLDKAVEDINMMMKRRGKTLTNEEKAILDYLYSENKN